MTAPRRFMRPWTRLALSAIYPPHGALPGVAGGDLDGFLDRLEGEAPLAYRVGLYGGSALFMLSPMYTLRRPVFATQLGADELDEHAHRLSTSPIYLIRQGMFALKMIAGMAWGADARVRHAFGMPPLGPDAGSWRGDGYVGRAR